MLTCPARAAAPRFGRCQRVAAVAPRLRAADLALFRMPQPSHL
jgi:hypothetical protein